MPFLINKGVEIHYLTSKGKTNKQSPLIFIPGMLGSCEQYQQELEVFLPRQSLSVSLRGCGQSGKPKTGYSFLDHCSDIESVIKERKYKSVFLFAYSRSVPFALNLAIRNQKLVRGLILYDYPAKFSELTDEWVAKNEDKHLKALQQELGSCDLRDDLGKISCPVLILTGEKSDSLLLETDKKDYMNKLANCQIVTLKNSGHDIDIKDYDTLIFDMKQFMEEIEKGEFY